MYRRSLLRAAAGSALVAASGVGSAAQDDADDPFEPLGRVDVSGAAEAVLGDDGEVVYLAATDGFATVDVSDPSDPTLLAERRYLEVGDDDGPLLEILDVAVEGDRLVVPGPANQGEPMGFVLFDVSDPADPEQASEFYETGFPIHNCCLEDGYLYLTGNGVPVDGGGDADETDDAGTDARNDVALVIVDVSGDDPEEVARWSLDAVDERWRDVASALRVVHDVVVRNDVAYLAHWDAGTYLLDVSDPTDPAYLSHVAERDLEDLLEADSDYAVSRESVAPPGNDHYALPSEDGSILAVGRESWASSPRDDEGGPSGIDLFDVSDPSEPERLSRIDPPPTDDPTRQGTWTTSHNFDLRDGRLYSSWYQGGVAVHDVGDPADPEELARWRRPDETAFWTAKLAGGGEFFVASSYRVHAHLEDGLYTFPARAGEQPDPPALEDGGDGSNRSDEGDETDDGSTNDTGSSDETNATSPGASREEEAIPGFGVPAALAGLGGAVALGSLARARDDPDGPE